MDVGPLRLPLSCPAFPVCFKIYSPIPNGMQFETEVIIFCTELPRVLSKVLLDGKQYRVRQPQVQTQQIPEYIVHESDAGRILVPIVKLEPEPAKS